VRFPANIIVTSVAVLVCGAHAEPSYQGKTLAEWVAMLGQKKVSHAVPGAIAEMGESAIPHLIHAMDSHRDGAIRWLCHVAIAKVGRPAVPELDRLMREGSSGGRIQAVLSLEKILGREAVPRLQDACQDADLSVRARAHGALIRLDVQPQDHLDALAAIARGDNAGAAWIAVEAIGQCRERAAGAEQALLEVAAKHGGSVARRATRALGEIGSDIAATAAAELNIRTFLGDLLPDEADVGLVIPGPQRKATIASLRALIGDRDNDVVQRGYATHLLDAMAPVLDHEPTVYHVAGSVTAASDGNPGTEDKPWRTIQHAAETVRPGDTVLIHDGLYRECVRPFRGGTEVDRMITYRAAPGSDPVITGADPWTPEWRAEGTGLWSAPYQRHAWDTPEAWPTPKSGAMHRAEQVIVDGALLTHVESREALDAEPGTFWTDDSSSRLWIHVPDTGRPSDRRIERATRQQCFAPAVRGLGNIQVAGLTMRYAAAPESNGANWGVIGHRAMLSVRGGHHWVIEDNVIEWGNAQGMDVGGEGWAKDITALPGVSSERGNHSVRRNRVNHHGVAGIVGWGGGQVNLLLEDNETSYNCRKGNLYQYEAAGVKLHIAQDCVIRRHRSHRNEAFGIWLDHRCLRNRVTQCVLTENRGAGFFFEVSAGPLLVDNNVILRTRNAPRGAWGEGIYSHDGNHAFYINNYIADCATYGVRIRNLFSRTAGGKPTTTSHNRVWNNIVADCATGAISLNPDVPRAEDNRADANVMWNGGRELVFSLDPGGTKIAWEDHPAGQAVEANGRGRLDLDADGWNRGTGNDAGSVSASPAFLGLAGLAPEAILKRLISAWGDAAPGLDQRFGEPVLKPVSDLISRHDPHRRGQVLSGTVRVAPCEVLQVWRGGGQTVLFRLTGDQVKPVPGVRGDVLSQPPLTPTPAPLAMPAGDQTATVAEPGDRVLLSTLPAVIADGKLTITAPADAAPGPYGVVLGRGTGWFCQPVLVTTPFELVSATLVRTPHAMLRATIANHRTAAVDVTVRASWDGGTAESRSTLRAAAASTVDVRLPFVEATSVKLTVELPGVSFTTETVAAFPTVRVGASWEGVSWHPIHTFPGGVFPKGAEAFVLYKGILEAEWAARYDSEALSLRVRVKDMVHLQTKGDDSLWQQDSVQLLLQAPGGGIVELDAALSSDAGERRVCIRESAAGAPKPNVTVTKAEERLTYDFHIPWKSLGLTGKSDAPLRLAFLVNNDNGDGRHGVQWFFGIHTHRHDYSRLGTLWLD
jgi:hypothetical protein